MHLSAPDVCIRPMPQSELVAELEAYEPSGWSIGRKAIAKAASEQNLLNDFEREERVKEYRQKLGIADWNYEHTDNHEAWRAGRDEFTRLYELQAEVDPDGSIWHSVAPAGFAVPQPRIVRRAAS